MVKQHQNRENLNILVISEYIAPVGEIGAIRWTKLSKWMHRLSGCNIDIVTNEKCFDTSRLTVRRYPFDSKLNSDLSAIRNVLVMRNGIALKVLCALKNTRADRTALCSSSNGDVDKEDTKKSSKNSAHAGNSLLNETIKAIKRQYWNLLSRLYYRSFKKLKIVYSQYDVVISSFGPKWPHYCASEVKREFPGIVWLADYRDYVASAINGDTRGNRRFVSVVTRRADCILSVSMGQIARTGLYLDPIQRLELVPNGFDDEDVSQNLNRTPLKQFEISYLGTLYNCGSERRDLRPLFEVFEELVAKGIAKPGDIRFTYAGLSSNVFAEQIVGFEGIVFRDLGCVSREESMNIQRSSALLAFATWNTETSQEVITGKLFEYLISGVPIVGVCTGDLPGSRCREIIEKSRMGFLYEQVRGEEDFDQLKRFVEDKFLEWKATGITSCDRDEAYISSFSYSSRAKQVLEIIESLQSCDKEKKRVDSE